MRSTVGFARGAGLNIGSTIADKFQGESTANIGLLELICLILQDDIMKMSDTVEQARNGSQKIDELLKQKLLSLNYDKSKYILLGNRKAKNRMKKELSKHPMKMGEETLENSIECHDSRYNSACGETYLTRPY